MNAALRAEIPRRVWRQAREVAIDFHDRPYYGKQPQGEGLWMRGKARDGTTRFYRIATAYVMLNGLRVTLALRFVLPEMEAVSLVDNLLNSLKKQGFQMGRNCFNCAAWPSLCAMLWNNGMAVSQRFMLWQRPGYETGSTETGVLRS